ncbi:MAG: excinuclease ABC subunit UvrC [Clostridia bacterium]|nr:excinuclease ABC subunit UvrC [Clostridia bacterium]
MTVIERLRDKANSLPLQPGVYIMKNAEGEVIYVGKSKRLKNRVSSYFTGTHRQLKTARMVSLVRDFDYIVCTSEIEALTLENTLIKKHTPKYNIRLKDAKSYPYIRVTGGEYPRLTVTRERGEGGRYFGPYQSAAAAYTALETVLKIFALPTCRRVFPRDIGRERPCIYRDMGRCIAPCAGSVSPEEYRALVRSAEGVLGGNIRETKERLTAEMLELSDRLEFERAAAVRNSISAIERLADKQKVVADTRVMRDVFALYTDEVSAVLGVLTVRSGALVGKGEFVLSHNDLSGEDDALSLIVDYYDRAGTPPREVMLGFEISEDNRALLSEYLSVLAERKVEVKIPERGDGRALCAMALENAAEAARQTRLEGERDNKGLARLSELLGLAEIPERIEAYDISNIGDESITASMVVCVNGKLKKSDYRSFTVRKNEGRDDYASMREALSRRLSHIGDGTLSLGERPDLILLDGGEGHVSAVLPILREMELDIPVFGMVKDDYHKTRAITDGKTEISIAREMGAYTFVYNLQEEAHRFAYKNTSGAKRRTLTHSSLEKIKGVGPSRARILLRTLTLDKIKRASPDELAAIDGISASVAAAVYEYFQGERKEKK